MRRPDNRKSGFFALPTGVFGLEQKADRKFPVKQT
jgi:hypothetical protein